MYRDPAAKPQMKFDDNTPGFINKQIITLIRSLYVLLRAIPAYKLCKQCKAASGASAINQEGRISFDLQKADIPPIFDVSGTYYSSLFIEILQHH
jgi:hypothetical protein